jgi:hypothetical protein
MGTTRHLYKTILLVFLIGVKPVLAADVPPNLHFIGHYDFDWGGIHLGSLVLGIDESVDHYTLRLQVASEGVANLFTRHMSITEATGWKSGNAYHPEHYESHYETKHKPRHVKLGFDSRGVITEEINEPPEDRKDRPEVPHNLKDGSYDPLSGLMALRTGASDVRAFDAKRLYDVHSAPVAVTQPAAIGNHVADPIVLSRTPLAGLTAKETKEYKKGEPQLILYFSNDARRIPLGVTMPLYFSEVRGVLVKECTTWKECGI